MKKTLPEETQIVKELNPRLRLRLGEKFVFLKFVKKQNKKTTGSQYKKEEEETEWDKLGIDQWSKVGGGTTPEGA